MNNYRIDPSYLRFIHDEMLSGKLAPDNEAAIPLGITAIYERQFSGSIDYKLKERLMNIFYAFSVSKGNISIDLLSSILNEEIDFIKDVVEQYSKLFNKDSKGRLSLYHDRLRIYLLQKCTEKKLKALINQFAEYLKDKWDGPGLVIHEECEHALLYLPSYLRILGKWEFLTNLLCDLLFIDAKVKAGFIDQLQEDYKEVIRIIHDSDNKKYIEEFYHSFLLGKHNLQRYPQYAFQHFYNALWWKKGWISERLNMSRDKFLAGGGCFLWQYTEPQIIKSHLVQTLEGHSRKVTACGFSPDGKKIISASWDKSLRIWDAETGKKLLVLEGHTSSVNCCAISTDGKKIVSGGDDSNLIIWDAGSGQQISTLTGHSGNIYACTFSKDGKFIVSGGKGNILKLWDVETGSVLSTFTGHSNWISSCSFSPDGKRIISGSLDNSVRIWDMKTGELIATLIGHKYGIDTCSFSPDGKRIISGSRDKTMILWDAETGLMIFSLIGHKEDINCCSFSSDGKKVVSASYDKTLKLWDLETGKIIKTFIGHNDTVSFCSFSPDNKKIISASSDATLKLWNIELGKELVTYNGHPKRILTCAFSPDGKTFVTGSEDYSLKLWDTKTGKELLKLTGHKGEVFICSFSPDGKKLASGSSDKSIKIWDVGTGKQLITIADPDRGIKNLKFSPNGKKIATWGDRRINIWNVETGNQLKLHKGLYHTSPGAFSPDGRKFINDSIIWDAELVEYMVQTKEIIFDHRKFWIQETDISQFFPSLKDHSDNVNAYSFSPDGKKIVSANDDTTLILRDSESGTIISTLKGHTEAVNTCVFSPDGEFVVSGGDDKFLRIWDVRTGRELTVFASQDEILACTVSGCGRFVICGDKSGNLYLLRLEGFKVGIPVITSDIFWLYNELGYSSLGTKEFTLICPFCGNQLTSGEKNENVYLMCPHCGQKLEMVSSQPNREKFVKVENIIKNNRKHTGIWWFHDDDCRCGYWYCYHDLALWTCCGATKEDSECYGEGYMHPTFPKHPNYKKSIEKYEMYKTEWGLQEGKPIFKSNKEIELLVLKKPIIGEGSNYIGWRLEDHL